MGRLFFKGLNELRAIAALSVLFHHIELYKHRANYPSLFKTFLNNFTGAIGKNGVYLFFVLSGFLITYLLLIEKEKYKKINIKAFFIRRVLRIWPLYYLIVALSFFLLPILSENFGFLGAEEIYNDRIRILANNMIGPLTLYLLFLPNVALITYSPVAGAAQAWSVGVEEQFYILWPFIVNFIRLTVLPYFFICFIILKVFITFLLSFYLKQSYVYTTYNFLLSFNIELMAIGGLGAYVLYIQKEFILYLTQNLYLSILAYCILVFFLFFPLPFYHLPLGIIFLFIILLNINGGLFALNNVFLSYLGKISYGIYMFHPIIMYVCFGFVNSVIRPENLIVYNLLIYTLVVGITLLVSGISYIFFEKRFIDYKRKFVLIESGNR